MDSVKVLI